MLEFDRKGFITHVLIHATIYTTRTRNFVNAFRRQGPQFIIEQGLSKNQKYFGVGFENNFDLMFLKKFTPSIDLGLH